MFTTNKFKTKYVLMCFKFFKGNNILYLPGMGEGRVFGTGWLIGLGH
jgi:hypothetical protein